MLPISNGAKTIYKLLYSNLKVKKLKYTSRVPHSKGRNIPGLKMTLCESGIISLLELK
jgi:hypothetical protein